MHVNRHHFDILDSTQNRARELLHTHSAAELPFLVTAREQTAGRGRQGRVWQSQPGNFYGSLALRAQTSPARYHECSFLMALVLRDTLAEFTAAQLSLKWPNDVLLDGKKCAGILIESEGVENEFLIIGIGVNLYHAPKDLPYAAAALWPDAAPNPERDESFTQKLLGHFMRWHEIYLAEGFATIRNEWLKYAHGLGLHITVTGDAELAGIFTGIDADGSLLLTHGEETRKVRAGHVA